MVEAYLSGPYSMKEIGGLLWRLLYDGEPHREKVPQPRLKWKQGSIFFNELFQRDFLLFFALFLYLKHLIPECERSPDSAKYNSVVDAASGAEFNITHAKRALNGGLFHIDVSNIFKRNTVLLF